MGSLVDTLTQQKVGPQEVVKAFEQYRNFLLSIKEQMPAAAYEFAAASWHYDHEDNRCPHDCWVESLLVHEPSSGSRHEKRNLEIDVRLLGAFHDGYLDLHYLRVRSYSFDGKKPEKSQIWHGDWLIDEVSISANGFVLHEVLFSSNARWLIESEDIHFKWV